MTNKFLMLLATVAVLGCSSISPGPGRLVDHYVPGFAFAWETTRMASEDPESYANVHNLLESEDPMRALYREDLTHDAVVDFFIDLTGSAEIALPIMYHAERADISLSLVFSLAWVESRYATRAVNRNASSTDRGVFQLNSRTFRDLTEEDFFHPDTNTYHGIDYLSWCMQHTSNDWEAVAVYNAGLGRVRSGRTPRSTMIYVDRIRQYRARLERQFREYILEEFPAYNT